ncbi:MAG: hypothetical protein GEU94_04810 [Micromonosporaceae bacterium]|nr:hypothetical protein [Micromonosporaceae bacterium]
MSMLTTRPWLRWAAPASVLVAVLAAGSATRLLAAEPGLPERSASDLLVKLQTAEVSSFSGTVVEKADLGLPSLPLNTRRGSSDLASLADGTHTLRLWYDGPERLRMALMGTLGESDVIRNGRDLWTWHSEENTATHTRLPASTDRAEKPPVHPSGLPSNPQEAADRVLDALDPSTKVTTDGTARVAGRAAYELVFTPRDSQSLVRQVRIALDGEKFVPLRVQVHADGEQAPALEVGFTQVSFTKPDASQFEFQPPPGAKVTEEQPGRSWGRDHKGRDHKGRDHEGNARGGHEGKGKGDHGDEAKGGREGRRGAAGRARPVVIGDGWTSVLVARAPSPEDVAARPGAGDEHRGWGRDGDRADGQRTGDQLAGVLGALPKVSGDWGSGRLLKTKLFSVLLVEDGRMLVGAVSPERLYEVAAAPKAQLND